jgi:hypothetical protein
MKRMLLALMGGLLVIMVGFVPMTVNIIYTWSITPLEITIYFVGSIIATLLYMLWYHIIIGDEML